MNDIFFILAQILAVVAFGLDTLAMQCKKKSGILIMGIASNMTYALEYAFLGAWTGAISLVIGTIRNITYFVFDKKGLKPNIYVLVIFISLLIGAGVYLRYIGRGLYGMFNGICDTKFCHDWFI